MRTSVWQRRLLGTAVTTACLGLVGCGDHVVLDVPSELSEAAEVKAVPLDLLVARARRAGALHTQFMRYAYEQLRAEWLETRRPLTRAATARVLKKACIDFYRTNGLRVAECNRPDRLVGSSLAPAASRGPESPQTSGEPYDQYLASVEYAGAAASDLQEYLNMLASIESSAIADPAMYADTLDLELVLTVTSVGSESAQYADTEVETWGELYDPCHEMIIREEWCPALSPGANLLRSGAPATGGPQRSLSSWGGAGWRILGADVGAAIGGGLWARLARAAIPEYAAGAAAVASATETALCIIEAF